MSRDQSVTAIIPAYNSARFLPRSIESILSQSHPTRVIVVNDGSKDNTDEVVARYRDKIQYVTKENGGVSSARNAGLAKAESYWVAFLDADDEWFPDKMARQMEVLQQHRQLRWCGCNLELSMNGTCRVPSVSSYDIEQLRSHGFLPSYFQAAQRQTYIHVGGIVVERDFILERGGFRIGIEGIEDVDMWDRLALLAPQIGYVVDPCYRYFVDVPNSLGKTGLRARRRLQSIAAVLSEAQRVAPEVCHAYCRYARKVAFRLLLAGSHGRQQLSREEMDAHMKRLPPSAGERLVLRAMGLLPTRVAERLEGRVRDWHSALQG